MDTIKELYYGNIHPYEREIKLAEMIERVKVEIAEEKAKLKEGDS